MIVGMSEGKPTRMRRLCLKTSKAAGGLQAYALTLPLLVSKCTWYETESRDMNKK